MSKLRRKALGILFFIAVIIFFAFYLRGIDFDSIRDIKLNPSLLALATIFSLGFRYWGVFIWRTILQDLGSNALPKFSILGAIYAKAWMGRYIPGTVTWIAGKIYLARSVGISKSRLAVASLLEGGMQVIALTTVSMFLLGFDPRLEVIPFQLKLLLVCFGVALLLILNPTVFNRFIHKAHLILKRKEPSEELVINSKAVISSFFLYAFGSFIAGTAFFLLAKSLYPQIGFELLFYMIGIFNLSGAIGMAVPFIPSGIGVRDGALLILLAIVLPQEVALALTVFSRLWSAAIDVLFYLLSIAAKQLSQHKLFT